MKKVTDRHRRRTGTFTRGSMKINLIITAVYTILTLQGCGGCETYSDAAQIRTTIETAVGHAEGHRLGELMSLTTEAFAVTPRQMDRQSVKEALFLVFRRYRDFEIHYPIPTVTVDRNSATAEARMPFFIVRKGERVPDLSELYENTNDWLAQVADMADLFYLQLWFARKDGAWLADKARIESYRSLEDLK